MIFGSSPILLLRLPFSYSDEMNKFLILLKYDPTKCSFVNEISQTNFSTGPLGLHRVPFSISPILLHHVPFTAESSNFEGRNMQQYYVTLSCSGPYFIVFFEQERSGSLMLPLFGL